MSAPTSQPVPSLAEWLRLLFGDILFPGRTYGTTDRTSLPRWMILASLGLVVCLAGLNMPLLEPDETRYAQIPREMLASGGLAVPLLGGQPYYDKPPLFYWSVACSYQVFGESIAAARLVPSLAVFATLLLTYAIGRKSLGENIAWRGAVLLALAPGLVGMGRLLLLDGLLTLVIFAGQSALWMAGGRDRFHRGWWVTATCLAGLGLMTKGPIALLLIASPLWVYRWLIPAPKSAFPTWKAWLGFGLFAGLIALPWHVCLAWRDPTFLRHYLWEHHVLRFLQPFDHVRGTFFYVPVLVLGLLPGSFLIIPLIKNLVANHDEERNRRTAALGYWGLCAGACIGFFSLSGCKLPTYVLPAFPALALVFGYAAQEIPTNWWRFGVGTWCAILLAGIYLVLPTYARLRSPLADQQVMLFLDQELRTTGTGLVAYPRPCHSISWQLNKADIRHFRSKDFDAFRADIMSRPRTVVLCTHRHSLEGLKQLLPPFVKVSREIRCAIPHLPLVPEEYQKSAKKLLGETALGLCDVAVLEVVR